jgi:hypothetical protein
MRVLTDGDDGLRNFVQRSSSMPMDSQLDWFHIGMKLELLRKVVVMPVTYQEYLDDPDASAPPQRRVSRLRDTLGEVDHGKHFCSSRGCAETSIDGLPSTPGGSLTLCGAQNESLKRFVTTCAETAEAYPTLQNNARRGIGFPLAPSNPS